MSRPLRIAYPGAWYHVMNRGRRQEAIFLDEGDYHLFLEVVRDAAQQWNIEVAAYCLMSNHYHLLVRTPEGNISRCMRHVNGVYTQRFNQKHAFDGSLFRGRYKAILVEEDSHLLELLRYIHRNPVKANISTSQEDYPWSSHKGYLSGTQGWDWLTREPLLTMFSSDRSQAYSAYLQFVQQPDSDEIEAFFSKQRLSPVFGSRSFIDKIKSLFSSRIEDGEIPETRFLMSSFADILTAVCLVCDVTEEQIQVSRRGETNLARDLLLYMVRKHTHETLEQIGSCLDIRKYSSVSSAIQRIKKRLKGDAELQKMIRDIEILLARAKGRLDP